MDGTDVDLTYAYDPAGNVTSITDTPTAEPHPGVDGQDHQCFDYDGLARLTLAFTPLHGNCDRTAGQVTAGDIGGAAPYWTEYEYDPLGNRTSQVTHDVDGTATTTEYAHGQDGAGPHQVTTVTTTPDGGTPDVTEYTYDGAGNRDTITTGGDATGFGWDAEGELVTAGVDVSMVYDASGDRLVRADGSGTTVYLPGGQEVHVGQDGTVSATRYYAFAGVTVAVRTGSGMGNVTSLVADRHGTPVAAVPNTVWSGSSVQRLYTDPFGATRGASTTGTVPGDTQFLGKTRDTSTGLTLLGAR